MGVKISELVKPAATEITMKNLLGRKIAIDAYNSLYQFLATIRQPDGTPLKDFSGNITSHLSGLFYRTINLIENDIKPVYIFDGPPNELKMEEIRKRREIREEERKKMEEAIDAEDTEEAYKHARGAVRLTGDMVEESKLLLKYMGVPYVVAAHDGEAEAARLTREGSVWAAASQDYDALLFGAPRLIRNLTVSRTRKLRNTMITVKIEYYSLEKILDLLEITREQLIDIGIMVGLDFFPGFKGIGEKTAYKLIKEYGSLDNIIEKNVTVKKTTISMNPGLLEKIRSIFNDIKPPLERTPLKWTRPDVDKIRELLVEKHNFNPQRLDTALERLVKKRGSKVQISLDKFLGG